MNKKTFFSLLVGLIFLTTFADYKILYITTPEIRIGGKYLKEGDVFSENSDIEWASPRQAIKVLNLTNDRQELIVAEKYKNTGSNNLKSYLFAQNQLSARKGAALNLLELGLILNDTFYLLDPIVIDTKIPADDSRFFYVTFDYNGETINKKLPTDGTALVFDTSLFSIDGRPVEPKDLEISVWYFDTETNSRTLVTEKMLLIPL